MIGKFALPLVLGVSTLSIPIPAMAQATEEAAVDPARLKLAEQTVAKLVPPGTYSKIMKDMMDQMAGGLVEQMMGMDAATLTKAGGAEASTTDTATGKTLGELAAEKDPDFKERMDITMRVMFAEMGTLMNEMEPVVRDALAKIYARKYSAKELSDMNAFFATPSGESFAGNFMSTFTDKEMMNASFGMMPKILEAMPAIMDKVEKATAHLPPLPNATKGAAADISWPDCSLDGDDSDCSTEEKVQAAAAEAKIGEDSDPLSEIAEGETADNPWYDEEKWAQADRKKVDTLGRQLDRLSAESDAAYSAQDKAYQAWKAARAEAIANARKKFKTSE